MPLLDSLDTFEKLLNHTIAFWKGKIPYDENGMYGPINMWFNSQKEADAIPQFIKLHKKGLYSTQGQLGKISIGNTEEIGYYKKSIVMVLRDHFFYDYTYKYQQDAPDQFKIPSDAITSLDIYETYYLMGYATHTMVSTMKKTLFELNGLHSAFYDLSQPFNIESEGTRVDLHLKTGEKIQCVSCGGGLRDRDFHRFIPKLQEDMKDKCCAFMLESPYIGVEYMDSIVQLLT